jgi:hypothetical protein
MEVADLRRRLRTCACASCAPSAARTNNERAEPHAGDDAAIDHDAAAPANGGDAKAHRRSHDHLAHAPTKL